MTVGECDGHEDELPLFLEGLVAQLSECILKLSALGDLGVLFRGRRLLSNHTPFQGWPIFNDPRDQVMDIFGPTFNTLWWAICILELPVGLGPATLISALMCFCPVLTVFDSYVSNFLSICSGKIQHIHKWGTSSFFENNNQAHDT